MNDGVGIGFHKDSANRFFILNQTYYYRIPDGTIYWRLDDSPMLLRYTSDHDDTDSEEASEKDTAAAD